MQPRIHLVTSPRPQKVRAGSTQYVPPKGSAKKMDWLRSAQAKSASASSPKLRFLKFRRAGQTTTSSKALNLARTITHRESTVLLKIPNSLAVWGSAASGSSLPLVSSSNQSSRIRKKNRELRLRTILADLRECRGFRKKLSESPGTRAGGAFHKCVAPTAAVQCCVRVIFECEGPGFHRKVVPLAGFGQASYPFFLQ